MRRFEADYLADTRRGMWADRSALSALDLPNRERVLDVGCGAGALTGVLREESPGTVVGLDADRDLLADVDPPTVVGDARRLPIATDAVDLVVAQALLINLPDPLAAVEEFVRVSTDRVAAIEPDNAAVEVGSTVEAEEDLADRARGAYLEGVGTDVTLGADAAGLFEAAGLVEVETTRYRHRQTVEPPYTQRDLEAATAKARGDRLSSTRETLLAGDLDAESFAALREDWRAMGREVVEQMRAGRYERTETVPFFVTVGRVTQDG